MWTPDTLLRPRNWVDAGSSLIWKLIGLLAGTAICWLSAVNVPDGELATVGPSRVMVVVNFTVPLKKLRALSMPDPGPTSITGDFSSYLLGVFEPTWFTSFIMVYLSLS